jgi:hypothetical protein
LAWRPEERYSGVAATSKYGRTKSSQDHMFHSSNIRSRKLLSLLAKLVRFPSASSSSLGMAQNASNAEGMDMDSLSSGLEMYANHSKIETAMHWSTSKTESGIFYDVLNTESTAMKNSISTLVLKLRTSRALQLMSKCSTTPRTTRIW